jgi:hypothetical protein
MKAQWIALDINTQVNFGGESLLGTFLLLLRVIPETLRGIFPHCYEQVNRGTIVLNKGYDCTQ